MASKNINLSTNLLSAHEMDENETFEFADQMLDSFVPSFVLNAIIDMGVLQIIHDNSGGLGLSPTEIAARIQAHNNPDAPAMLDRMLLLLATNSVVTCTVVPMADGAAERLYKSSPVTKCFVPDEDGVSLAPMLSLNTDKVFLESWTKLKEAVFEGGNPFQRLHGMQVFDKTRTDSRFNETFNRAMYEHSIRTMKMILGKYEGFIGVERLVDVGGGLGQTLGLIASKYPSMKCINFDLPHVIQYAPQYIGVEHIGGDMFDSIPKGDAIFLKWILHSWSDEHCLKLLKSCYKSLPENGKVIIVDSIVPDEPDTSNYAKLVARMDVCMMIQGTAGGKERTIKEFESLAKSAGFAALKLVTYVSRLGVMELYKS